MDIAKRCLELEPQLIEWRRQLHQHPELSLKEEWTSNWIAEHLKALHIPVHTLPGTYSLIGVISGKKPGKRLALRADFDALPITEQTDKPYCSKIPGVMHACGHDAHVSMLMGAATLLKEMEDDLCGTIYLCFQAAEELSYGVEPIVDWLEAQGGVDRVLGIHIWSTIKAGTIVLPETHAMAGTQVFRVTFTGMGGHGSRPDLIHEPIKAACDLVLKLSSIPSNFYDMQDNSVIHVGKIQAGTLANIFPNTAVIEGGCRYFKPAGHDAIMGHVKRMAQGVAQVYDVSAEVEEMTGTIPVINDPAVCADVRRVADSMEGLTVDRDMEALCASDNVAYMLDKYPGVYGFLGAQNLELGINWPQHHCQYDVDESVLKKGCEFFLRNAEDFLR